MLTQLKRALRQTCGDVISQKLKGHDDAGRCAIGPECCLVKTGVNGLATAHVHRLWCLPFANTHRFGQRGAASKWQDDKSGTAAQ